MNQLLEDPWFLSIASSLAASLIWALVSFLTHGLIRQVLTKSSNLAGEWDQFDRFPPVGNPVGVWRIRQLGSRVWARSNRVLDREGAKMKRTFRFRGQWVADQLTVTFRDASGKHRAGAVILHWVSSREPCILAGKAVYWDRTPSSEALAHLDPDGVSAYPYCLRKRVSSS